MTEKLDDSRSAFQATLWRAKTAIAELEVPASGVPERRAAERPAKTEAAPSTRKSQGTLLIEMAEAAVSAKELDLFHAPDQEGYASITMNDHIETWLLRSKTFRCWISRRFFETTGKAVGSQGLQDALNVLEAKAKFAGPEHAVCTRIAEQNGHIYVDLGNERWEAVVIDATGWRVTTAPPVRFVRARGALPLASPVAGGSHDELRSLLNVDDRAWTLIVAWLLAALRPTGPYPVLVVHGEQGSGKSWFVRLLRGLIDPNVAPLRAEPRDGRDLMIAARNGWVIALDNLSRVEPWLSDCLCRLSTGGGFSTRELYSDFDEVLFDAQRPVVLNGIEELATRGDLLDRAMVIYLPTISEERRASEAHLRERLERVRPRILGALLDVVVGALQTLPSVRLSRLPRLADFAVWMAAAEPTLGWEAGTFMRAYQENRDAANSLALEASLVAPVVLDILPEGQTWKGTAAELLDALDMRAGLPTTKRRGWPASPKALSGQLRRLAPILKGAGVYISFNRDVHTSARRRLIELKRRGISASESSEPSESLKTQTLSVGRSSDAMSGSDASNRPNVRPTVTTRIYGESDESDGSDAKKQAHSSVSLFGGDELAEEVIDDVS